MTEEEIVDDEPTVQRTDSKNTVNISDTEPIIGTPAARHISKQPNNRRRALVIMCIILVTAALLCGTWFLINNNKTSKTVPAKLAATTGSTPLVPTTVIEKFAKPTTGETWNAKLIPISDPGYISPNAESNTKFYEVGKRGSATIIMAVSQYIGYDIELFERSKDGTVTYIEYPNNTAQKTKDTATVTGNYDNTQWTSKVTIDKTTHYDSLTLPASFSLNNTESVNVPTYTTLGDFVSGNTPDSTVTTTVLKTYGSNTLVKIERKYIDTGLTAINYAINTGIGTQIAVTFQPINPKIDNYTWDNGITTTGTVGGIVRGCGAVGNSVSRTDVLDDSSFTPIGKSDTSQTIYGIKDPTSILVQKAYNEYKDFNSYNGAPAVVSFDTFIANHVIFAYKSVSDGWLIYTIDTYAPVGGCAKPVVYLYPTQTEPVTVRVGADVKVSEPLYNPSIGWQNVIASPNGQLSYQGKSYSSLFWEGPGYGAYPAITTGSVVSHSEATTTIKAQLGQQGLNATEINDFMAYWQSRIPHSPYIRLVWFSTTSLNTLAPLYISPAPSTLIRVFLDMQGLDQPISMPTPTFVKPARSGFTVVEWGGLAHTKLY